MISALLICTITTFSEPFKRLAQKNKILATIGSLGLLPGFIVAAIVGYFTGEITWNIEWGLAAPAVKDVYLQTSPLSIGFPPTEMYLEVLPLVIIGYLLSELKYENEDETSNNVHYKNCFPLTQR